MTKWNLPGNGERVEQHVVGRWDAWFGLGTPKEPYVIYDGELWADGQPKLGEPYTWFDWKNRDQVFMYRSIRLRTRAGDPIGYKILGKWWKSSGKATVLTIPRSWFDD